MVRAKFRVDEITQHVNGFVVKLHPVYSSDPESENGKFYKYTPSGEIVLATINADAAKQFEVDAEYYVDFTPAALAE